MFDAPSASRPATAAERPPLAPWLAWLLIAGLGAAIWLAAAWHERNLLPSPGWRLLAIFLPTILALVLRPLPGGAAVLLAVLLTVLTGTLTLEEALGGYADRTAWLVLAAYFYSRPLLNTGLARRIALTLVRLLGRTTLGLSYALMLSDTLLAAMIPSNAARLGGVVLPITRSLAEVYQSFPGRSAGLLGTFLMLAIFQGDMVACALFLTGQAGNPLGAQQAARLTQDQPGGPVVLSYATWFWYALAPAAVSLLLVPALVYRLERPAITRTPEAAAFARTELARMGPLRRDEWLLLLVFAGVCTLWVWLGADYTTHVALAGVGVLLLSGVLTWEDAINERSAWDVFIWYGGLLQLGKHLNQTGVFGLFAGAVVGGLEGWHWVPLFLATLLVYFYAHYAFASITAHLVALYPAFVSVLIAADAPAALVATCFVFFANFSAGLTHYSTTPAPIIFGLGYVPAGTWWRVGFWLSVVNITVWLAVGMPWWKLLGLW